MPVTRIDLHNLKAEIIHYLIDNRKTIFDSDRVDWIYDVQKKTLTLTIFRKEPRLSLSGEYIDAPESVT